MNFAGLKHPEYTADKTMWDEWRLCYSGGSAFREEYLKVFSAREDATAFADRKAYTPITAFAKSCILEVKNSIFQRLGEVKRLGGPQSYQKVISGLNAGIDRKGSSMNTFIGQVLDELLPMKKVGIWVDRPNLDGAVTKADTIGKDPYLYTFPTEDILSWAYNDPADPSKLTHVLLRENSYVVNEEVPLPTSVVSIYRYAHIEGEQTVIDFFTEEGEPAKDSYTLEFNEIPFVIMEMTRSLMEDVTGHQIALLNMESGDVNFCLKANFPFYIEQYDAKAQSAAGRRRAASTDTGTEEDARATASSDAELRVGSGHGRLIPGSVQHMPAFIHPSPDPLMASIKKEEQLKEEIRLLIHLSLSNTQSKSASAESKAQDNQGLENGLSALAVELERGERRIGHFFAVYENSSEIPEVTYPDRFSLQTNEEKIAEINLLDEIQSKVPSVLAKKETLKLITTRVLDRKIPDEVLIQIMEEIDAADAVVSDPDQIKSDLEAGLVSEELASSLRGYPEGEVAIARRQKAERLAMILETQSASGSNNASAARGIADASVDASTQAKNEKTVSQSADINGGTKAVRGEGAAVNKQQQGAAK